MSQRDLRGVYKLSGTQCMFASISKTPTQVIHLESRQTLITAIRYSKTPEVDGLITTQDTVLLDPTSNRICSSPSSSFCVKMGLTVATMMSPISLFADE